MNEVHNVLIEHHEAAGIPFLAILPNGPERAPLVFFVPGFTGNKTDGLSLGYQLASRGLACVCIDPLYHGDRYDARLANPPDRIYPPETGLDVYYQFLQIIHQCSLDIQTLLSALKADSRFDTARAGVTGMSMGAYASFLAFADIDSLHCAVPMMGIPTFTRRWLDLLDECAWSNSAWASALVDVTAETAHRTEHIRSFDPDEKKTAPRPLLVMSGDFDSDQPKHYVLDWFRSVRPAYTRQPEYLRWNIYPVGHTMTRLMEADAADWFVQHLKE